MSGGFSPAPGTDYTAGAEPEIARRLNALGQALGKNLIGISGYRTPQHSVAVGGFANDPHTHGLASDTVGAESIPESVLRKYGLTRPLPGAREANHIQLAPAPAHGGGGFDPLKVVGSVVSAVGQDFFPHKIDPKKDPLGTGTADVQKALATGAGDVASQTASWVVNDIWTAASGDAMRVLLYILLVAGGLALTLGGARKLSQPQPS